MISTLTAWSRATVGGLPRSFWFLTLGTFVNRAGIFVLPFLSLFLTTQRHLPVEEATAIVSLYGIGSFTAQVSGGYLADRLGRRMTMLISLFVSAALMLFLGTLTEVNMIAPTTLLLGLFSDMYRPASSAIIADVVAPDDRARAFSLRYWAINLGAAVGLSLGGVLAQTNYTLLFIGDALTTAGFGLIILFFVAETHDHHHHQVAQASDSAMLNSELAADNRRRLIFALLFATLTLLGASVYFQASVTMPLDMAAKGLSPAAYGFSIALNAVLIVLFSIPINRFFERRLPFRMIALASLFIGMGFGLYAIASSLALFAFGVVIWTTGEILNAPVGPTLMAEVAPKGRVGFYQGLLGAAFGLSAFTGPLLGGFLYSRWGSVVLWIGCFVLTVVVALGEVSIMAPLYNRLKKAENR